MTDMPQEKIVGPYSSLKDRSVHYGRGVIGASERDRNEVNRLKDFASDERGDNTVRNAAVIGGVGVIAGTVGYIATHQPDGEVRTTEAPSNTAALKTPAGTVEVTVNPPTKSPNTAPTKSPEATPTGTFKVEVSPTLEPSKTPEVIDVPCTIFTPEICKLGKRVEYPLNGKSYTFIGINLPSGIKTPIFAGADGKVATGPEQGNPFNGTLLQIKTATGEFYDIRGNINVILTNPTVKSGDQMGYAQATTAKSLGYDVVFTITTASPNGTIVEEDKLKQLFKLK